jgi:hypothetical protein
LTIKVFLFKRKASLREKTSGYLEKIRTLFPSFPFPSSSFAKTSPVTEVFYKNNQSGKEETLVQAGKESEAEFKMPKLCFQEAGWD